MKRVAVVTGANRGIGFETARQLLKNGLEVILTARDSAKGQAAQKKLADQGLQAHFFPLDVTDAKSIDQLKGFILEKFGRLDVLVNNAGVMLDKSEPDLGVSTAFNTKIDTVRQTMETNVYGPFLLSQTLAPLMKKNHYGRIVNVSSGMGQLSEMNGGWPAYRVSKTALNAVTRISADELEGSGVLVNSVCPGWVKTDMGGPSAERPVEKGAETLVWLSTLPDDGPTGGFFRDRERIAW